MAIQRMEQLPGIKQTIAFAIDLSRMFVFVAVHAELLFSIDKSFTERSHKMNDEMNGY